MISTKMTAEDEDDHLWHYLNRVSLQLMSLLDFDRGQSQPTSKTAAGNNSNNNETKAALKSKRDTKHTSAARLDSRSLECKQTACKSARPKRGQQQRHLKRNKQQAQHQQQRRLEDPNANVTPPDSLFSDQFKGFEDEKQGANEQPMSSCVLHTDQISHEHYISATEFDPSHHNHLTTADNVVESIIQLDGNGSGALSSVGLLALAMPDDNLGSGQHHHHQAQHPHHHHHHHHQHHHQQQLGPNHSSGSLQNGELLASPTPIRLSPTDQGAVQLGANVNSLGPHQGNYYTVSSLVYDDFIGHNHHHQNGTPSGTQAGSQPDGATGQTSPSSHYQPTGEQMADCYAHHGHLHQAATVHQYQHIHFDHQAAAATIGHHELQTQQQPLWLNQQHQEHHGHHSHRQAVDQHDIEYHANPSQAYQQPQYSNGGPHLVDHQHNLQLQHHVGDQHHHQSHHEHQLHNDNNSSSSSNQHHLASQRQQHMTPPLHHLHAGHHNAHHHHSHHHGHLIPPLGPLVNGIECSSVILHDINLASASWSSPDDLYSI